MKAHEHRANVGSTVERVRSMREGRESAEANCAGHSDVSHLKKEKQRCECVDRTAVLGRGTPDRSGK